MSEPRSYRIGDMARLTGVTPEALRFYEREGLLPPLLRSTAGARRFSDESLVRVRFIKHAQAVGLTLKDIKTLTAGSGASRAACRQIRNVLAARLADLDSRMAELQSFRATLANHLQMCDRALAGRAEAECPTIDAIGRGSPRRGEVRSQHDCECGSTG